MSAGGRGLERPRASTGDGRRVAATCAAGPGAHGTQRVSSAAGWQRATVLTVAARGRAGQGRPGGAGWAGHRPLIGVVEPAVERVEVVPAGVDGGGAARPPQARAPPPPGPKGAVSMRAVAVLAQSAHGASAVAS